MACTVWSAIFLTSEVVPHYNSVMFLLNRGILSFSGLFLVRKGTICCVCERVTLVFCLCRSDLGQNSSGFGQISSGFGQFSSSPDQIAPAQDSAGLLWAFTAH